MEQVNNFKEITITASANNALKKLSKTSKSKVNGIRLFVSGNGCSGVRYGLMFENNIKPEEYCYEEDELKIVIDDFSLSFLHGACIDYLDSGDYVGFVINNPNLSKGCDCNNNNQMYNSPGCDKSQNCNGCG